MLDTLNAWRTYSSLIGGIVQRRSLPRQFKDLLPVYRALRLAHHGPALLNDSDPLLQAGLVTRHTLQQHQLARVLQQCYPR